MSKTTETDTFRRLKAFMKDVDGDQRQIIKCLQDQVEYLLEKNRIYEEVAVEKNGGKQIVLSDDQKKRLAVKGKRLNEFLLGTIEQTLPRELFSAGIGIWSGKSTTASVLDKRSAAARQFRRKSLMRCFGFPK